VEALRTLPSILWVFLAFVAIWLFRAQIKERIGALRSLEGPGGVKAQFDEGLKDAARATNTEISYVTRTRLEERIARSADQLRGAHLLWIDDVPSSTLNERTALTALGVVVDTAISSNDAEVLLKSNRYDAVISDIARGDSPEAGLAFISHLRELDPTVPLVFYIRNIDPKLGSPAGALGLTNRPDELLDLLLDAFARSRG